MARRKRWIWITLLGLLALLVSGGVALYWAVTYVPHEYQEMCDATPAAAEALSREMLQRATALASDVKREGRWQAVFTADQINSWLAVDLVENHAQSIPPGFSDPRVRIGADRVTLFCRYRGSIGASVLSLEVEPYLAAPDLLAVRIRHVRAGVLPLPLGKMLDQIRDAAERQGVPLSWRQSEGDPVAMIPITALDQKGKQLRIDAIRVEPQEISISGETQKRG